MFSHVLGFSSHTSSLAEYLDIRLLAAQQERHNELHKQLQVLGKEQISCRCAVLLHSNKKPLAVF